jgi:hypothetical protein
MKRNGTTFLIFFGIVWSALVLVADGFVLVPACRQLKAQSYLTTEGTILSSEVTTHSDSDGTTYGVAMKYSYEARGRSYTGDKYRYDNSTSSDHWAYRVVEAHPPGKRVTVFFNPLNPGDAVLSAGLHGGDLFLALFLTPFNAVMLGFLWAGVHKLWSWRRKAIAGGVQIRTSLRQTRIRLTEAPIAAVFLAIFGLTAFLSLFIIAPLFGGFHPSMLTMQIAWPVVLAISFTGCGWHAFNVLTGKYDLILDELGSFLELPATQGRKARKRVPLSNISGARTETLHNAKDSDAAEQYAMVLEMSEGEPKTERLAVWSSLERATAFVEWLRSRLPANAAQRSVGPFVKAGA